MDNIDWIPPPPPVLDFYSIGVGVAVGENILQHEVISKENEKVETRVEQLPVKFNSINRHGPCEHKSRRFNCMICNSQYYCPHGKAKYYCGPCGGAGICSHNRKRSICRECGGASICEHDKHRSHCTICSPHLFCEHNKRRSSCDTCSPYLKCEHGHRRYKCRKCWTKGPFIPPQRRSFKYRK